MISVRVSKPLPNACITLDQECIRGRSVQLPIYAMELSKTQLCCLVHFQNFHIRKFFDSCMTILTSRTAVTADSVKGTHVPCIIFVELHLTTNPLKGVESLRLVWQQQLMPQEKPKAKERNKKMSGECVMNSATLTSCFRMF